EGLSAFKCLEDRLCIDRERVEMRAQPGSRREVAVKGSGLGEHVEICLGLLHLSLGALICYLQLGRVEFFFSRKPIGLIYDLAEELGIEKVFDVSLFLAYEVRDREDAASLDDFGFLERLKLVLIFLRVIR